MFVSEAPHVNPNVVYRDPNQKSVVFLGAFEGTNAGTNNTILDSSTTNATITRAGASYQGSISPFSPMNWSCEFIGSSSTYLRVAADPTLNLLTTSFSIEGFFYSNGPLVNCDLIGDMLNATPTASEWAIGVTSTGALQLQLGTSMATTATGIIKRNEWHHFAVCRTATDIRVFVDGVVMLDFGAYTQQIGADTRDIIIGSRQASGAMNYFTGFMYGVRVLRGQGFYNQNFQVTTVPLKNDHPACVLLLCQGNRHLDQSAYAQIVTPVNGPIIRPNSPLAPLVPYSTTVHGGSIRTGAAADYMTIPSNALYRFLASQDFTIEGWYFPLSTTAEMVMVSKASNMGSLGANGWLFTLAIGGIPTFSLSSSGTAAAYSVTGPAIVLNAWNHVCVVRRSGVNTVYTNGVAGTSVTNTSASYTSETEVLGISYRRNGGGANPFFNGFMSQVRIVKGTAAYAAAFTPPTTPLTAITNTILLLNFTNASIVDISGTSNIGTAGTAPAISTARAKYGLSSLLMNGAGSMTGVNNNMFGFGTADFTIEGDVFLTVNTAQTLVSFWTTTASIAPAVRIKAGALLVYSTANVDRITATAAVTLNVWHEFSVSRINGVTRLFVDGTLVGTPYTDTTDYGTGNPIGLGDFNSSLNRLNGNLDNVRVMKGTGLYGASYTPLTKAFAVQ